jgi:hypothetical protein
MLPAHTRPAQITATTKATQALFVKKEGVAYTQQKESKCLLHSAGVGGSYVVYFYSFYYIRLPFGSCVFIAGSYHLILSTLLLDSGILMFYCFFVTIPR